MTDYRYMEVPVWTDRGGRPWLARNTRVNVLDWVTGLAAPGLTQNGQPVSYLTSDSQGVLNFTSTVGIVTLSTPSGPPITVYSPDKLGEANGDPTVAVDAYISSGSSAIATRQGVVIPATISHADVQAALTSAASTGRRVQASGTYTTSSTLTITGDCDLSQLAINYTGTGTAVQVGSGVSDSSGILFRKDIRLPVVINASKVGTGWTAGTIGVRAINTFGCSIRVPRIRNFETGYYADGLGTGNVYNDVQLLHLDNNKRNLYVGAGTGGWCNSNTYRLGSLQHDSVEGSAVSGVRQIILATATNIVNGNLFIGGSVEGNTAEYHLDCDGLYNRFIEIRWENSGGCRIRWGSASARNLIDYGYSAHQLVETHVAGSSLNRLLSTGTSYQVGSTAKALNVWENTSSSTAGVDAIMDPGARLASTDPVVGYRVLRTADATKMKRADDTNDRLVLDHTNGRVYFGNATGAITMYLAPVSTSGISFNGANLYFGTDNANDIGLAGSLRPRYVRVGTAIQTGAAVTGSRPAASTAGAGAMFYDTTLSKPIFSDGTTWRDATGTAV